MSVQHQATHAGVVFIHTAEQRRWDSCAGYGIAGVSAVCVMWTLKRVCSSVCVFETVAVAVNAAATSLYHVFLQAARRCSVHHHQHLHSTCVVLPQRVVAGHLLCLQLGLSAVNVRCKRKGKRKGRTELRCHCLLPLRRQEESLFVVVFSTVDEIGGVCSVDNRPVVPVGD